MLTIINSYIIAGWIWITTWGIYQIPLSMLCAAIILRLKVFNYFSQAMGLSFLFYAGATFFYWLFLFLPVHILTPDNHQTAIVPSAALITFFTAIVYTLIQSALYKIVRQKYSKKMSLRILCIIALSNTIGALLALYSLRFVGTIIDW